MSKSSINGTSSSFATLLGIVFIVLKLTNVIDWRWIWVLAPFWIGIAIGILILLLVLFVAIFIKAGE